jgi:hypothetical protein
MYVTDTSPTATGISKTPYNIAVLRGNTVIFETISIMVLLSASCFFFFDPLPHLLLSSCSQARIARMNKGMKWQGPKLDEFNQINALNG